MAGGNVSEACLMLQQKYNRPIGRSTIYNAIKASSEVHEAWVDCQGAVFDISYRGVAQRAEDGNARDQRLLVTKLGGKYGLDSPTKVELTGADGAPIKHEVIADGDALLRERIAALDDGQLAEFLKAAQVINHGPTTGTTAV